MNLLYIVNGLGFSKGMPIGGADKRAVEIGKRLAEKGFKIGVLTTSAGKEVLESEGLKAAYFLTSRPPLWLSGEGRSLLSRIFSYFYLTIKSGFVKLPLKDYELVYPTSDIFFDLVPARILKIRNKRLKFVGIVHHWIESPAKRKGKLVFSLLLFLSQRLGFLLLRRWAEIIFVPQTPEGERVRSFLVKNSFPERRIFYFRNGVDLEEIASVPEPHKGYEACFLGSLRPSKGIFDLVPIWKEVRKEIPNARLLVIGGGTKDYEERLREEIRREGLEEAVVLAGVVPRADLYRRVKSAKVFLAPSYEEGWGIALAEGIACGLPAVVYDIPAFRAFSEAVVRVRSGDKETFAKETLCLLGSSQIRSEKTALAEKVVKGMTWAEAAGQEERVLTEL